MDAGLVSSASISRRISSETRRLSLPANFVPGQTPRLAVDRRAGAEPDPIVARRVLCLPEELNVQVDRLGDLLDHQLAVHHGESAVDHDHVGPEGRYREVVDVEEVARAKMVVAPPGARADNPRPCRC